jgi:hypothetical protein
MPSTVPDQTVEEKRAQVIEKWIDESIFDHKKSFTNKINKLFEYLGSYPNGKTCKVLSPELYDFLTTDIYSRIILKEYYNTEIDFIIDCDKKTITMKFYDIQ